MAKRLRTQTLLACLSLGLLIACVPFTAAPASATSDRSPTNGVQPSAPLSGTASNPPLGASLQVNPDPVNAGSTFSVTANVNGGVAPYTFSWVAIPSGCPAPGNVSSWNCNLGSAGQYPISLQVSDSNHSQFSTGASVTVSNSGNNGNGGGNGNSGHNGSNNGNSSNGFNLSSFGPFLLYGLIGAIVGFALLVTLTVAVVVIAVTLSRRLPRVPKGGTKCSACSSVAPPGAQFCPACGKPMVPVPAESR